MATPDIYTHGHHESVLRSHRWRTAENSAGYLLASLRPGLDLLDVGCGPGTITLDLAARVHPGRVIGLDAPPEVIAAAEGLRASRPSAAPGSGDAAGSGDEGLRDAAVSFVTGDVYHLDYADGSFDVVHAHQVLQHLTDPVAALAEMRRVLRPAGVLAVRDADYGGFFWAPAAAGLARWLELYHQVTARNGATADAGRDLLGWAQAAGFSDIQPSSSTWTFADPDSRQWWGGIWADRVRLSSFASQAVAYGLADETELEALAAAWRTWAQQPDGFFVVPHGEILARP